MSLKVDEIRRRTSISPVSTGSVAPNRGKGARKARTRKVASIMSPRACLIASAASSRSYSEPSVMTRSTPSESCSEIWSSVTSGTSRSPRRSCASRRWAFSMARSPPLTATYMRWPSLTLKPRGARDRDDRGVIDQHDVDAARKQYGVDRKPREQIVRLDGRPQRRDAVDAWASEPVHRSLRQALDLQDQRRRP